MGKGKSENSRPAFELVTSLPAGRFAKWQPGSKEDRAHGAAWGIATGDSLGAPLEFMSAASIKTTYGSPVTELVGGGWLKVAPGEITDDTQMALCLARSIREAGEYDPQTALKHYQAWASSGPIDIGATIGSVLRAYRAGGGEDTSYQYHLMSGGKSAGNGALMRCMPLAFRYADDSEALERAARQDSKLTHYDPLSEEACVYYLKTLANLITGSDQEVPLPEDPLVKEAVMASPEEAAERAGGPIGFVLTGLAVSMSALRNAKSYEEGLVWTVNLGGDADTNGAITGALLGARFGASQIPARWLEPLEGREELAELTSSFLNRA